MRGLKTSLLRQRQSQQKRRRARAAAGLAVFSEVGLRFSILLRRRRNQHSRRLHRRGSQHHFRSGAVSRQTTRCSTTTVA